MLLRRATSSRRPLDRRRDGRRGVGPRPISRRTSQSAGGGDCTQCRRLRRRAHGVYRRRSGAHSAVTDYVADRQGAGIEHRRCRTLLHTHVARFTTPSEPLLNGTFGRAIPPENARLPADPVRWIVDRPTGGGVGISRHLERAVPGPLNGTAVVSSDAAGRRRVRRPSSLRR